jgi:hypothetical protein
MIVVLLKAYIDTSDWQLQSNELLGHQGSVKISPSIIKARSMNSTREQRNVAGTGNAGKKLKILRRILQQTFCVVY